MHSRPPPPYLLLIIPPCLATTLENRAVSLSLSTAPLIPTSYPASPPPRHLAHTQASTGSRARRRSGGRRSPCTRAPTTRVLHSSLPRSVSIARADRSWGPASSSLDTRAPTAGWCYGPAPHTTRCSAATARITARTAANSVRTSSRALRGGWTTRVCAQTRGHRAMLASI